MASALILPVLLAVSLLSGSEAAYIGGATSVANLMGAVIPHSKSGAGPYASVGSGQGIACFSNVRRATSANVACASAAAFAVGVSDDPMTSAQDIAAGGKFTIPLALGTYSLATTKASGLRISSCLAAKIFVGRAVAWSKIRAGLSGRVVPCARSDSSGTTELFGKYFRLSCPSVWPSSKTSTTPWGYTSARSGTDGVGSFLKATPNSLGYMQSGIAKITYGLKLVALESRAKTYVLATNADPAQAVPRILPSPAASWASVSLLYKAGAGTYPVESFAYMFVHKKYGKATTYKVVKVFIKYTQTSACQNLMKTYFFWNLPSKVIVQGLRAAAAITL